jgi:hypothetical protein
MAKSKRLLSATGLAVIVCIGFVLASQWGHAAEPPAYPVRGTLESMQLLRDEHDLVAEMIKGQLATERGRYTEQRTAIDVPGVGAASLPQPGGNALRSRRG